MANIDLQVYISDVQHDWYVYLADHVNYLTTLENKYARVTKSRHLNLGIVLNTINNKKGIRVIKSENSLES